MPLDIRANSMDFVDNVTGDCGHDGDGLHESQYNVETSVLSELLTPIVISLEVAKNQYMMTPMKDEYNPN